MTGRPKKIDTQVVELAGRNWLTSELLRAGIEVARPERDRGVDLIAYIDIDTRVKDFVACPIQMKASTRKSFSLFQRQSKFRRLILTYVWDLGNPAETKCYALTYSEALRIVRTMGATKANAWKTGGKSKRPGFSWNKPPKRLCSLLAPYEMNAEKWWGKISSLTR
jgi:hypothetical protein